MNTKQKEEKAKNNRHYFGVWEERGDKRRKIFTWVTLSNGAVMDWEGESDVPMFKYDTKESNIIINHVKFNICYKLMSGFIT